MTILCTCAAAAHATAFAQVPEVTGSRAAGMGGAFVAVANDSSATRWNPGALAAGPFLDMALAQAVVETRPEGPASPPGAAGAGASRSRTSWLAVGTPPFGVSYYRFQVTDIRPFDPTEAPPADREERGVGVPVRSLAASQLGVTLVQTVTSGVHTGATLKFLRGTFAAGRGDERATTSALLDQGEALEGGDATNRFDLDVGLLATAGVLRLGARVQNLFEPSIGPIRLERQTRVGAAFDLEAAGGVPLMIAIDADVDRYAVASGPRRIVALGAEQWMWDRRVALRAGGRLNTVGTRTRSATAGASVAVGAGFYLDGHVLRGGAADERGWGVAARVSF